MRKVLLLIFVGMMVAILVNRQRVYVRDPLATVYRNGVRQSGVQVFINYSNDVLLERDAQPGAYRLLVQGWNKMPGTPMALNCMRWMACLADADHATAVPIEPSGTAKYDPQVTMTNREVSFVAADGAAVKITLR